MSIVVTARDTESGDVGERAIEDDYILITAGRHYLDGVVKHQNGTIQLTIKVAEPTDGAA
jgi:hypothetical protein